MKAIKNGKRYNTKTSTEVAKFWNSLSTSDFNHIHETLYRTTKGNWFLLADGGAMTKYSKPVGNMTSGSSDNIVPLTESEALEWLERHEETTAIEQYFEPQIEEA